MEEEDSMSKGEEREERNFARLLHAKIDFTNQFRTVGVENFSNSLEGKVQMMLICRKLGLCETLKLFTFLGIFSKHKKKKIVISFYSFVFLNIFLLIFVSIFKQQIFINTFCTQKFLFFYSIIDIVKKTTTVLKYFYYLTR